MIPASRCSCAKRGFTLIELMIAMALGLAILLFLAQGFRYATEAMRHARRLSLENGMLRGAFVQALEEADYWTNYDWPEAAKATGAEIDLTEANTKGLGLRGHITRNRDYILATAESGTGKVEAIKSRALFGGSKHGMLFTPFKEVQDLQEFVASGTPLKDVFNRAANDWTPALKKELTDQGIDAAAELERGWNKHAAWNAADPRTWYRGCPGQQGDSDLRWGHFGLLSHPRTSTTLGQGNDRWVGSFGLPAAPVIPVFAARPITPLHTWRENQLLGLRDSLGYYGMLEYLPANAVLATHGATMTDKAPHLATAMEQSEERVSGTWVFGTWNDPANSSDTYWFNGVMPMKHAQTARAITGYGVPVTARSMYMQFGDWDSASRTLVAKDLDQIPLEHLLEAGSAMREWFPAGSGGGSGEHGGRTGSQVRQFRGATFLLKPQLPQKPDTWPDVYIGQRRFVVNGRFVCVASVRWASPTGGQSEISFSTFGTSLRGARQQRHRDGGWAAFHGVTYDRTTGAVSDLPTNDPTLDEP